MSQELVTITVDGKSVQVPKGMLLVEAAKAADIDIPVFCYHPKLDPAGVCRMCLVEVEGQRKPVTACTTPVADGMVVRTQSDLVKGLQRGVIEFLLLNHPLDCPVCDKGGECPLQDNTFKFGPGVSRSLDAKVRKDKAVDLGNFIVFDQERCILCRRCTRFDNEITQERHLVVAERAHENIVTTADGKPFNSYFSGNTIELCPVGALTSNLYRFKARPWDVSRAPSVCTGCSVGCNISLDFRFGELVRVLGRDNPEIDGGWLCDRGRFNYRYTNGNKYAERLERPMIRKGGELVPVSWEEALQAAANAVRTAKRDHGGASIGAIGGARLSNEEAYLLQKLVRTGFGSPNVDWRTGEQYVASNAEFAGRISDISRASAVLLVDVLPAERAPVADLRIRRVSERGGAKVVAVGPAMPTYRARCKEYRAHVEEIPSVLQDKSFAREFSGTQRLVALWSGRDAEVGKALVTFLRKVRDGGSEVVLLIPGEQANAWGAEALGVHPHRLPGYKSVGDRAAREAIEQAWQAELPEGAGLDTEEMLERAAEGRLQVLYLAGANLMSTHPDRSLVESALGGVGTLIVQDLFMTETAAKADILFPASSFPARTGHFTTFDGTTQRVDAAWREELETKVDAAIFAGFAAALGVKLYGSEKELAWEMQHLAGWKQGERLAAAPSEMTTAPEGKVGSPARAASAAGRDGLRVVAVERLFAGGGTSYFDVSIRHARPAAAATLHPQEAERLGLAVGDSVELQGEAGTLSLAVATDPAVTPGTVQVPKGLVEAPVNALGRSAGAWVSLVKPVAEEVG